MAGDRPGQPMNEIFGIKRTFQQSSFQLFKLKESSVRMHQI